MTALINLHDMISDAIERAFDSLLPLLARLVFAAVLLVYFWNSALTKVGDGFLGLFQPSTGAYAQIFPKAMEAVTYDVSQLGAFHWLVVVAGMWAEFLLPLMILLGLATRLAALGMIGFVAVQSLTDLYGHGGINHPETFGTWFDRVPDAAILDQRALWMFLLLVLVIKGGGALSLDRIIGRAVLGRTHAD
ncbi:MAG: DoxX family membrane protein [Marinovum algicola]|jgi:putative oxidoreductase|uniref:Oxidoreductase n=1 Tax=Marinovum algicola TaxID=42444 RepID=A0A975ZME7_9RHOB|nr:MULTISPECIES: DoxX family membrane protein [Marinovum]MDD9738698.1 DoxX family membrane protein [Marinovum sp. SP66]SEI95507.1 putative oxidoreductase [Marinovum algicola]SLN10418.1 DoxX [Marinovum algicola]